MEIISTITEIKKSIRGHKERNLTIGFVPTMGFLHEGHLSLVSEARKKSDIVILSIFVNPKQFSPNEDYDAYPRNFVRDEEMAQKNGVDLIFYPKIDEMYGENYSTYVNVNRFSEYFCGNVRLNHFQGVATVVLKLFNIIKPDFAVFGQKDAQQLRIIQQLVEDLNLDIAIIKGKIVRDENGLALSSRNAYLSITEKIEALGLIKSLILGEELIKNGVRERDKLIKKMKEYIINGYKNLKIDYIDIVNYKTWVKEEIISGTILLAGAVYIGNTRLIDNIIIKVDKG